jgi:hypothetical protein
MRDCWEQGGAGIVGDLVEARRELKVFGRDLKASKLLDQEIQARNWSETT